MYLSSVVVMLKSCNVVKLFYCCDVERLKRSVFLAIKQFSLSGHFKNLLILHIKHTVFLHSNLATLQHSNFFK